MASAILSFDSQQYAAIIGKRAEYYLPHFERFARGGYLSWNWPAFINTLAWLRYRKLYAWSWLYFFVSSPLMLSLLLMLQFTDPCQRALAASRGDIVPFVFWIVIALGFVVPPLLANRIYFEHVRSLLNTADGARARGSDADAVLKKRSGTGWILDALLIQAAVLGVGIGMSSFENVAYRFRVSEGLSLAAAVKPRVADHLKSHGQFPATIEKIAGTVSGDHASRITMEPHGTIKAVFGRSAQALSGHSVSLVPRVEGGLIVDWTCRSDDLPDACLPLACRTRD